MWSEVCTGQVVFLKRRPAALRWEPWREVHHADCTHMQNFIGVRERRELRREKTRKGAWDGAERRCRRNLVGVWGRVERGRERRGGREGEEKSGEGRGEGESKSTAPPFYEGTVHIRRETTQQ